MGGMLRYILRHEKETYSWVVVTMIVIVVGSMPVVLDEKKNGGNDIYHFDHMILFEFTMSK